MRAHLYGDRSLLREDPVQLYVTGGAREWRGYADWPPPGATERTLWLAPGGALRGDAPTEAAADAAPTRYRYDPADPTPSVGGPVLMEIQPVVDNRPLESRDDVVTYTGEPLQNALEAIGPVGVDLFVRSSGPHFDVFARVTDVHPDRRSVNVCDALVRVTPEDFEHRDDGSVRVQFPLWPTAHRFDAGHSIRLQISSGAHPRYARNTGTGEPPTTAKDLRTVDMEILQDPDHPSSFALTVV
jgi:putative CocE/NonD family hydrolase